MPDAADKACQCWVVEVPVLHDGHCCLRGKHADAAFAGRREHCHPVPKEALRG